MKFIIKKNDIIDVLSRVQGITGRKSNLAITENILIQARSNKIFIYATDLETGFEGSYPSKIESEGIVTVNSKKIYEIVRNFPSEDISFEEIENRWLKIGNKNVLYNLVGMDTDDFPEIPHIEELNFISINSYDFKKMIEKSVMIGAPTEEKRAHILGVKFECMEDEGKTVLRMISTDGKRLSKTDNFNIEEKNDILEKNTVIIPKKGLNEVGKFLDQEGTIQIGIKQNNFIVKKENETIIINLLEGEFPEYSDIISNGNNYIIEVDKHSFRMMLKRMSILTSDDYKGVIFKFDKNRLVIRTANPDIGESKENMNIDFKGDSIEVAFNPYYFIDTLNLIDSNQVLLKIKDDEHPCFIQGKDDKSFLSIIMPMKI